MRVPTDPLSFELDHRVRTTELTANTLIHPNNVEMEKEGSGTRTGALMDGGLAQELSWMPQRASSQWSLWSLSVHLWTHSSPTLVPLYVSVYISEATPRLN